MIGHEEDDSAPAALAFDDIVVVPFSNLHDGGKRGLVGGPIWPDWDAVSPARHFWAAEVVDDRPPPQAPEAVREGGDFFWAGPIHDHFGHQVVEFSMRIPLTLQVNPAATLVFSARLGSRNFDLAETPAFFRAILDWFGVPPERVLIVDRPTLFRRLHVTPQGERQVPPDATAPADLAAAAPRPAHLRALTEHARARLGAPVRQGVVFVSRSALRTSIAGESDLDTLFERSGARVFRPEQAPLAEQLATYASAATLVFADGSAVHGLQLMGRNVGKVILIRRRAGNSFGVSFVPPRAETFAAIDAVRAEITGACRRFPRRPITLALGLLDLDRLLAALAAEGVDLRPHLDRRRFAAAEARDLRQWFATSGRQLRQLDPRSDLTVAARLLRRRPPGWIGLLGRIAAGPAVRRLRRWTGRIAAMRLRRRPMPTN